MLQLRPKVADPVADGAVTESESVGDVTRCVLVDEDCPQNFITALFDRTGGAVAGIVANAGAR